MPNAAMSASAASASDTRERLWVPDDIDAGLRSVADGRMGGRHGPSCSVHGQPVHSAQRAPEDVFHQYLCELAVSTYAIETVDARGQLEAMTIRLVFVEKDGMRDGRARDVGAEESLPNAGDEWLEAVGQRSLNRSSGIFQISSPTLQPRSHPSEGAARALGRTGRTARAERTGNVG